MIWLLTPRESMNLKRIADALEKLSTTTERIAVVLEAEPPQVARVAWHHGTPQEE